MAMRVITELYERLKRKLTIEQRRSNSTKSKLSRTQSAKEMRQKRSETGTIVVRPRADTEIVIEKRRYSKSVSASTNSTDNNNKITVHKKPSKPTTSTASSRRSRADSAPSAPIVSVRRPNPSHLGLVSTGSMLAPTYRSRTATVGKATTVVRVTVE
ncbi:hypothetical protein RB195_008921 [Necator americanus]|uniref:Uncharacterized protein n=1 Tax=Necator americanus TaxID=51031 RepID=A0ABR1CS65_NECAM